MQLQNKTLMPAQRDLEQAIRSLIRSGGGYNNYNILQPVLSFISGRGRLGNGVRINLDTVCESWPL